MEICQQETEADWCGFVCSIMEHNERAWRNHLHTSSERQYQQLHDTSAEIRRLCFNEHSGRTVQTPQLLNSRYHRISTGRIGIDIFYLFRSIISDMVLFLYAAFPGLTLIADSGVLSLSLS